LIKVLDFELGTEASGSDTHVPADGRRNVPFHPMGNFHRERALPPVDI
jgi:hypothetical protein